MKNQNANLYIFTFLLPKSTTHTRFYWIFKAIDSQNVCCVSKSARWFCYHETRNSKNISTHTPYMGMYNCYHIQHISINYFPIPPNKHEIDRQFKMTHWLKYNHLVQPLLLTKQKQLILFTSPFRRHYILGIFQTQSEFHIYLIDICHPKYSEWSIL